MSQILVTKRDGTKEPLNLEKFHVVVKNACEGLTGVSASEVELRSQIQFYDGIKSSDIQELLINSAANLITEETPNYQYVAGRLISYHLRKQVYGRYTPTSLQQHYCNVLEYGYYDKELSQNYSAEEWEILNKYIDHDRDDLLVYAAMETFRSKYLVRNRVTGQIFETPQMVFMLMAMKLFQNEKVDRLKYVKEFYDEASLLNISLPSPIMAGVRTPTKQFSSCVLIESGDSLESINATTSATVLYAAKRAGIGIGAGRIRAENSAVRGGEIKHTGSRGFYRLFNAAIDSCSQGGLRKGSANLNYVGWHREFRDLIVLKNNKGTEDNRIKGLDYTVQLNRVMYERLLSGGNITFFCPNDVPEMYEYFFTDVDKFRELYEKAERSTKLKKWSMPAEEFFREILTERKETGRIYISNVDNMNDHSSFITSIAPVKMTNLCVEITLPTKPLKNINDPDGEIALCTLAAIPWKSKNKHDFEKPTRILVRALDNLLTDQEYPIAAAENATKKRRPLGIGITNFAYWMAKNDLTYSDPDLSLIDEFVEAFSYYLIKASADLAIEREACSGFHDTKYSLGQLPIHTYKKTVDELVPHAPKMDWEGLTNQILITGIRNSTLMAGMPCETSSAITNSTNGMEPVRSLITVKIDKDAKIKQVVPEIRRIKNKYELLWTQKNPKGYLKIMAVIQKYFDQALSVNTTYCPPFYEGNEIPESELIEDLVQFYKYGGKNEYYFNTYIPDIEDQTEDCEACKV